MEKEKNVISKRKWWFRLLKKIMKIRYKRPAFIYLGEKITNGGVILSNHEGTDAPMSLEIYLDAPIRMWGASEMNSGLKQLYKYQTRVYYHEKKHWNLHLARLFCLIASPLTNMFYKGLNLISTYHDQRFIGTIKESINALRAGENIVIYPEDSTNGYLQELEGFHLGFTALCEVCKRRGMDLPIYVSYFRKSDKVYIIDKPIMYSELSKDGATKEQIADRLRIRCNELGKMQFDELTIKNARKKQKNY
ncbi:MAG: hypothetical protein E7351_01495 [Clostridiales bacterium]|nr:hypothetical protein [Clostridiales bacterium]